MCFSLFSQYRVCCSVALSPMKDGQRQLSVVTRNLHRHYLVVQAGWNVVQCSHRACYLFEERRTFLRTSVVRVCAQLLLKRGAIVFVSQHIQHRKQNKVLRTSIAGHCTSASKLAETHRAWMIINLHPKISTVQENCQRCQIVFNCLGIFQLWV